VAECWSAEGNRLVVAVVKEGAEFVHLTLLYMYIYICLCVCVCVWDGIAQSV
jgi:hypothetical protein